ncbi:hypothetical protein V502_04963 [Pseudogymnoascus sp. VKM F-4520 (FW-2644)]|nr:hypothetical protein V502_04963 [Pseudogymnoascus sp. VKM F-4520 (FW-2644)]
MMDDDNETPVMYTPPGPSTMRPKGILKHSYRNSPSSPAPVATSPPPAAPPVDARIDRRSVDTTHSDKDITLHNTAINAGHRRASSSASRPGGVRRRSSISSNSASGTPVDDTSMRLKWDEANLYLTEQEKSSTMKIDEPKTPYACRYDPDEDADEMRALDAEDIVVDELDKAQHPSKIRHVAREDEIPGLELGEPEEALPEGGRMERSGSSGSASGKAVHVRDPAHVDNVGLSEEEKEKHRRFEAMRKRHYEMREVASHLGHAEGLDADDEDQEGNMNGGAQ